MREGERERNTPRMCTVVVYAQAFQSSPFRPPHSPSPNQHNLTPWIFGSPICVQLVVAFIRYVVVSCREHLSAVC